MSARAERDVFVMQAALSPGAGSASLRARLPIRFRVRDPALCVDRDAPMRVELDLDEVSVAALSPFIPGIARGSGVLDGEVRLSGTIASPHASGQLQLEDVAFTVPRPGQRFSHVRSKVRLAGRTLTLRDTYIEDRSGEARLSGKLHFHALDTWNAEFELHTDDFPVRRTGILLGHVDADAYVTARHLRRGACGHRPARNDRAAGRQHRRGRPVAPPHPDIVFASELDQPQAELAPGRPQDGTEVVLHVETSEPAWVRRNDFAVTMTSDVYVTLENGRGPTLRGVLELRRGYVSLLGQSFDIERGRVQFTGDETVDPLLEITATQSTAAGAVVKLEVTGFVSAPELAFFVDGDPVTAGEALMPITGQGGGADTAVSAQQQLTSAAIGMTTGLLSLAARQEFGDWMPLLSIEGGGAQTRARIGFDADRLIPDLLDGFVRGAYVEGVVATERDDPSVVARDNTTRPTPGGGGVLLELLLPGQLVWVAQCGPGNTWSVDLRYRP